MRESEARALASELEHNKTWRMLDVQRNEPVHLPAQWGVYVERRDNPRVLIFLDSPMHDIITRSLAWGESHELSPHYVMMLDGTMLISDIWQEVRSFSERDITIDRIDLTRDE